MKKVWLTKFSILVCVVLSAVISGFSQDKNQVTKSREIADDGIPVLTKHLPDWENARNRSVYILNQADLRNALGNRAVFDSIEFESGTEAVTAPYNDAKLLIVEFSTPQASVDADEKIKAQLNAGGQTSPVFYRRIGNYNVFVFDTTDEAAALALLDQVKYEKNIQWLGRDPFLLRRAERAFVNQTADLFMATTIAIAGGLGLSVLGGIAVGFFFFYLRERKRSTMQSFSDAGGMTRLNLDGFTPQTSSERLLRE